MEKDHNYFMNIALAEARKGLGRTSPNPAVGAVIVKDNQVIGAGYHQKAGTPHAEVNALNSLKDKFAKGSTMYVTLEPCNHHGKTPPCTQAILAAKISRVVVGYKDPNPSVKGNGMEFLRANGVDVVYGVLEKECREIVHPFLKHSSTGMPWVVMKAGMSLDGKISYKRNEGGKITGKQSQVITHNLRNRLDAILIGVETALIDNPSLTTRLEGENGRDPIRVILDSSLQLSPHLKVITQISDAPTIIFCTSKATALSKKNLEDKGARVIEVRSDENGRVCIESTLSVLGKLNITSVLVEGGSKIHGSFFTKGLVDEIHLFIAPFLIGDYGTPVIQGYDFNDCLQKQEMNLSVEKSGQDVHCYGFLKKIN